MNELIQSKTECAALLNAGDVSSAELVEASIERIEAVDGEVNALPERCFERARERAKSIQRASPDAPKPWLGGLPIAVKDYNDVGGVRTTYGSPIYEHNVPAHSDATVATLEANGRHSLLQNPTCPSGRVAIRLIRVRDEPKSLVPGANRRRVIGGVGSGPGNRASVVGNRK